MIRETQSLEILGTIFVPERKCDATIHASSTLSTVSILGRFVSWQFTLNWFRAGITLQTIQCGVNIAKHQKPITIDSSYKNYQRWLNPAFTNTIPTEKRIIWYLLHYFK